MTKLKNLNELAAALYSKLYYDMDKDEYTPEELKKEYETLPIERQRTLKNAIMWLKDQPRDSLSQELFPEFYARTWHLEHAPEFQEDKREAAEEPDAVVEDADMWCEVISELREYFASVIPE